MEKVVLVGNPNSGKTTLFNALTGMNQYVGNWPGVTVEKKEGKYTKDKSVEITDLPGIYSLSPYTLEEVIARDYIMEEKIDCIINIVDATNLERNLYLTTQVLEMGIPVVVALNMADLLKSTGEEIDVDALSKTLGCKVVLISALRKTGIDELMSAVSKHEPNTKVQIYSDELEDVLNQIDPDNRYMAVKIFERDSKIPQHKDFESLIASVEEKEDDDSESIITSARYEFIASILDKIYIARKKEQLSISDKIDKIVTNRWLAIPIFVLVMYVVYYVSVSTVGTYVTDWTNDGLFGDGFSFFGNWVPGVPVLIGNLLDSLHVSGWLYSLIIDGIVGGVGAVLGFVPQMFVLFFFLAFLEYCGYMSRIAFILDRVFRRFGLSGKSFIPMLIGSGCGVPGIMASRTIENEADRRMTIITTTFIPCGAKLPIIALIAGALFDNAAWVSVSAYFLGVAAIIVSGIILKKTKQFASEAAPFIMELPAYHWPTVSSLLRSMWERGWSFIKRAGTIILASSVIIWFLESFGFVDGSFGMVDDLNDGLLANIGSALSFVFKPLGFGSWKPTVATITGLVAKEEVVSTFGVLYGMEEVAEDGLEIWAAVAADFTQVSAYSFLAFNLLCAPCFAAMGAIKREMNNTKWTVFAICYQCVFAYLVAFVIYNIGNLIVYGTFGVGTVLAIAVIAGFIYLLFRKGEQPEYVKEEQLA